MTGVSESRSLFSPDRQIDRHTHRQTQLLQSSLTHAPRVNYANANIFAHACVRLMQVFSSKLKFLFIPWNCHSDKNGIISVLQTYMFRFIQFWPTIISHDFIQCMLFRYLLQTDFDHRVLLSHLSLPHLQP